MLNPKMKQKNKWKIDKFMKLENPTTPTKTWSTEIESDCKLKNTTNMCFILDPYLDYNPDLDITDLDGKLKHNNECFIQKSVNWFLKTKLFIRSLRHNEWWWSAMMMVGHDVIRRRGRRWRERDWVFEGKKEIERGKGIFRGQNWEKGEK